VPQKILSLKTRTLHIVELLRKATAGMTPPASTSIVDEYGRNPFLILISCLLSLRTKDTVSLPASRRIFEKARTPQALAQITPSVIEKIIYPVGFYRTKAKLLPNISKELLERFDGHVPQTEQELLSLKGVGRKTANLVLAEGFGIPAICVDTHVHRIANRLGIVRTTTPEKTEFALKELLPSEYWREINQLLVMWGQNICVPISPFCSQCALVNVCPKIGISQSR
jgi:endonuclease III